MLETAQRHLVLVCAVLAGCSGVTQLIVVTDTDYDVPTEIDEIVVDVTGPSGTTRTTMQSIGAPAQLPMTLTVVPAGEALGPVTIRAVGRRGGVDVASQLAVVTLESGRSLVLRMFLARTCTGVACPTSQTCVCGECTSVEREPGEWTGSAPTGPCMVESMDAGPGDAAVPMDATMVDCTSDGECDDGIECTTDSCAARVCEHAPTDGLCTAGTSGTCIVGFGCQYDGCSPATCVAGPCQIARCEGDNCVLESACASDQQCCAGACVRTGCEDDNPCTDDACGASGCQNAPNTAACDDGVFCNGPDTCGGSTCETHAGDPCSGTAVCDEGAGMCVGCASDMDCPADVLGPWGSCAYADTCATSGTRTRTITSYACASGVCNASPSMASEACTRPTDGTSCGSTTFGAWGACGMYSDTCDESGTRTRTRTDRTCMSGACASATSPDPGPCVRDTDATTCGTTTYGSWGSCGGFSGTCGESGTRSRTQTDFTCVTGTCTMMGGTAAEACTRSTTGTSCGTTTYGTWGACGGFSGTCDESGTRSRSQTEFTCMSSACAMVPGTDSEGCSRTTTGVSCGMTMYGPWGPCGGFSDVCDQTGTRSRTAAVYTCGGGMCSATDGSDSEMCARVTEGNSCEDLPSCRRGSCSSGSCSLTGAACRPTEVCCEPGICVGMGMFCP